jgi:hypothetical protein
MNKNNFYTSFAVWLIILPLLGVPIAWKNILVFLSGLFLLFVALGPLILKKLQMRPKKKITHPPTPSLTTREGETEKKVEELRFSDNEN